MAGVNRRAFNVCVAEMRSMGMDDEASKQACMKQARADEMAGQKKPKAKKVNDK